MMLAALVGSLAMFGVLTFVFFDRLRLTIRQRRVGAELRAVALERERELRRKDREQRQWRQNR